MKCIAWRIRNENKLNRGKYGTRKEAVVAVIVSGFSY